MRRVIGLVLLALAVVSPLSAQSSTTAGPTTRYSRLYVFGDSYSDIGAGYIDGNGPTAVAYLGWLMACRSPRAKRPARPARASCSPSAAQVRVKARAVR